MRNSLWPHGLQHTRLRCPSPSPRVCSNSCPLSQWYHLTITSSAIPFSSCLQSFPASGSFPTSQLFASGGQSIRASVSASGPSNEYSGLTSLRIDWSDLLTVQGTLKSLLQHHISKAESKALQHRNQISTVQIKEWFLWTQPPASSHTQKSAKFLNLGYLVFFN